MCSVWNHNHNQCNLNKQNTKNGLKTYQGGGDGMMVPEYQTEFHKSKSWEGFHISNYHKGLFLKKDLK